MVRRVLSACQKPRRVCAEHGANEVKIIFSGGKWVRLQERKARLVKSNPCSAYVGENTSRPASVEFLRQRRGNYARSRVQSPSNASPAERVAFERLSKNFFDNLSKPGGPMGRRVLSVPPGLPYRGPPGRVFTA